MVALTPFQWPKVWCIDPALCRIAQSHDIVQTLLQQFFYDSTLCNSAQNSAQNFWLTPCYAAHRAQQGVDKATSNISAKSKLNSKILYRMVTCAMKGIDRKNWGRKSRDRVPLIWLFDNMREVLRVFAPIWLLSTNVIGIKAIKILAVDSQTHF
jgi:hypothetical protein